MAAIRGRSVIHAGSHPPVRSRAGLLALTFGLLVLTAVQAWAQGTPAPPKASPQPPAGPTDTVIISNMPERKGVIYSLLKRLFCHNNGAVTGVSNSEVWSVPRGHTGRVSKWLESLGMKVTRLREDWNHLLKRHQGPMTTAQQEMLDKVRSAPGTMGVQVLQAPDAALTAFLMTNELAYRPSVPPELKTPSDQKTPAKEQAPTSVVLPISPTKNITLERVRYSSDEHGCTWHGIVAETGESALLIGLNGSHITGLVSFR